MKEVRKCPKCGCVVEDLKKRKCPDCNTVLKTKRIQGAKNRDGRLVMVCPVRSRVFTSLKKKKCAKCGTTLEQKKNNRNGHLPRPRKMAPMMTSRA